MGCLFFSQKGHRSWAAGPGIGRVPMATTSFCGQEYNAEPQQWQPWQSSHFAADRKGCESSAGHWDSISQCATGKNASPDGPTAPEHGRKTSRPSCVSWGTVGWPVWCAGLVMTVCQASSSQPDIWPCPETSGKILGYQWNLLSLLRIARMLLLNSCPACTSVLLVNLWYLEPGDRAQVSWSPSPSDSSINKKPMVELRVRMLVIFLFLLLSWQGCADVAKHTNRSWCLHLGSFSSNWVRAGTCIISLAKNRWTVSWSPFMAAEETFVTASPLCLPFGIHLARRTVMVIWAELKTRNPSPVLGAEPEQELQRKTPGLSLQKVKWRKTSCTQVSLSQVSLRLLQSMLLFRWLLYLNLLLIITWEQLSSCQVLL